VAANKLVAELTTMSAPHSMGRTSAGWRKCCRSRTALMIVGDAGQGLDFRHVEFRIAQRLGVERLGFGIDRFLQAVEIVAIDEAHLDAQLGQRVVKRL